MANTRANNVLIVDTSAAFEGPLYIKKIKYAVGGATSAASIKKTSSSGTELYAIDATADTVEDVCINALNGAYVTITDSAKLYIYLK